jgi:hypothetical protein
MLHRVLCLLLIVVLPASQAAIGFAHAHSGNEVSTPHVHLPWTSDGAHSHSHDHAHSHHHHGHHHHEPADHKHQQDDTDLNDQSLEHQGEAVVFCTEATFLNSNETIDLDDSDVIAFGCLAATSPAFSGVAESFSTASATDAFSSSSATAMRAQCAVFLQTSRLRL